MSTPAPAGPANLDQKECALLVLGCQPGILGSIADADTLISKINTVIEVARLRGSHIAFVRVAFDDLDYRFTPTTNKEFSALAREKRYRNSTPEAALHEALAVQCADIVVRTKRLGAFSTTDLDEQLTNLGVTTLIVSGAHTSGTVLSTIREAADRDYRLLVLSDCCADPDQGSQDLLMARIFPRQAEITTSSGFIASLRPKQVGEQSNPPAIEASQAS